MAVALQHVDRSLRCVVQRQFERVLATTKIVLERRGRCLVLARPAPLFVDDAPIVAYFETGAFRGNITWGSLPARYRTLMVTFL